MFLSDNATGILICFFVCVLLPSIIVWLITRMKINKTNKQTEIILAALQKNAELDAEELLKRLTPPQKTEAEKQTSRFLRGCIMSFLGLAFLVFALWVWFYGASQQAVAPLIFMFVACSGTGGAYLLTYYIKKKALEAKE